MIEQNEEATKSEKPDESIVEVNVKIRTPEKKEKRQD